MELNADKENNNVGIIFDTNYPFKAHSSKYFLNHKLRGQLSDTLGFSNRNYCNSMQLQKIQSCFIRFICSHRIWKHATYRLPGLFCINIFARWIPRIYQIAQIKISETPARDEAQIITRIHCLFIFMQCVNSQDEVHYRPKFHHQTNNGEILRI